MAVAAIGLPASSQPGPEYKGLGPTVACGERRLEALLL